ncbi:hypothetical protein [Salinarimonas chemoclinalis]|uniref:hypothetical protein n=1 Tax=Salinarimonas chemoclinalis TaxID=3241599 RepID=UPI0035561DBF
MSAGTVPDRRALSAAAPSVGGDTPSWRVAALGFTLSLGTTVALAFGLAAL